LEVDFTKRKIKHTLRSCQKSFLNAETEFFPFSSAHRLKRVLSLFFGVVDTKTNYVFFKHCERSLP